MYEYIIFDADHTLIDFNSDEKAAFRTTFSHFGARYTEADVHRAWVLSYTVWAEQGLNDVHLEEVQRSFHKKYVEHLPLLFDRIKEFLHISASSEALAACFFDALIVPSKILGEGLKEFVSLSRRYKTCIATNGLAVMQTARLSEFLPYAHAVFVSETLGTIKPDVAFFTAMLSQLHAAAEDCLFVGDSLSSDVAGCAAAGINCIWFNPEERTLPPGYAPLGVISRIEDVEKFL